MWACIGHPHSGALSANGWATPAAMGHATKKNIATSAAKYTPVKKSAKYGV